MIYIIQFDPSTASLYIAILSAISTLSSMYGMLVIFRAAKEYMKPRRLGLKFFAIKLTVIILNIQTQIFGLLAKFDVLPCKLSRGGKIRASSKLNRPYFSFSESTVLDFCSFDYKLKRRIKYRCQNSHFLKLFLRHSDLRFQIKF